MKFTLNHAGVKRIAEGPGVVAMVNRNADRVLAQAKGNSAVDDEYRASLSVQPATVGSDEPAKVQSSSPFWHLFEFGSIKNPPYRPLTRAVIDAGLKFEEH